MAGVPGALRESPFPSKIADGELVMKVHAWAMNPADGLIQDVPLPFVTYPLVLGEDVSGTVEVVGAAASSGFKVGDRILALALGSAVMKPEQGAFQEYVVIDHTMACKIPDSLSFGEASVFPLGVATAAHGLFSKDYLGLPFPKVDPVETGKSIFIWGGSSSVGSNAIQLCKAAGFRVITTCSAANFDYVKNLGADKVFDYNTPSAIDDIAAELDNGPGACAGIFQAAGPVGPSCQVAHKSTQKLPVVTANPAQEGDAPEGVEAKFIYASGGTVVFHETSPATFGGFLPEALAKGIYKVAPNPQIVSRKGLEGIQEALDILKRGVSAKKVVVEA